MGILERVERIKQVNGELPTFCKKCDKKETTKFYDSDIEKLPKGSFTKKCDCGTWIYRFHNVTKEPDPNNLVSYFTKAYLPAERYDPEYNQKDGLEKMGFKKQKNGKYSK